MREAERFTVEPRESKPRNETLQEVSRHFVPFLRRWHAMEGRKRDIIDFDLATEDPDYKYYLSGIIGPPIRAEREQTLSHLVRFEERIAEITEPKSESEKLQFEFLKAKIKAHITYFGRKYTGESVNPLQYIEDTMGVKPELIPQDDLLAQKEVVISLFSELGYDGYSAVSIARYRDERFIREEDEILEHILINSEAACLALSDFLGREISPSFHPESVFKDRYWLNWANGDRNEFSLQINLIRKHRKKWTAGKAQEMTVHEVAGHFGQMTGWLKAIDSGDLIPVLGLTSVHDPEQVITEGIGQTLPYFVPEIRSQFSAEAEFELEMTGLRAMVYNNVHMMVNSDGFAEEGIIEYVQKYLPAETEDEIRKEIKDRTTDPLLQTYRYAYGIGFWRHRQYAQSLNSKGKRELLRLIYNQPLTPEQEERFVDKLLKDPQGRYSAVKH